MGKINRILGWRRLVVFGAIIGSSLLFENVLALVEPGGPGDGISTTCNSPYTTSYTGICPGGWGGASWRIYKAGESGNLIWGNSTSSNSLVSMDEAAFNDKKNRADTMCKDEKGNPGYYLAIGWDRKGGTHGGFLNGNLDFVGGGAIISYNSYNAVDSSAVIRDGPGAYVGRRLTRQGAQALFNKWIKNGGGTSDSGSFGSAGWFCLDPGPDEPDDPPEEIVERGCDAFQPSSFTNSTSSSGTSSVISRVKNKTLNEDYQVSTWAKPTDDIRWLHCYFPGAQKVANTSTTGIGVITPGTGNHGAHSGSSTANSYSPLSAFFPNKWSNYYQIKFTNLRSLTPSGKVLSTGVSSVQEYRDKYLVQFGGVNNKAGKTLTEENSTGFPINASVKNDGKHDGGPYNGGWSYSVTNGCAKWVEKTGNKTFDPPIEKCDEPKTETKNGAHTNDYMNGSASGDVARSSASVNVPYNFINTAEAYFRSDQAYVYAGETVEIAGATAYVRTRYNDLTKGAYATNVNNASVRLVAFIGGFSGGGEVADPCGGNPTCVPIAGASGLTLNPNGTHGLGSSEGSVVYSTSIFNGSDDNNPINVFDAPAGSYFCIAAAVYPSSSGTDNMMSASGSGLWYVSEPDCRIVAKKPSLQVWGSGMFTAGLVSLVNAEKRVVAEKFNDYDKSSDAKIVFGSWVEHHIVANGKVSLASGASTGGPGAIPARTVNGLPGSYEGATTNICIRSPLTMPNRGCSNINLPGGANKAMKVPTDREALIARFMSDDSSGDFEKHETCAISGIPTFTNKRTHVYVCNRDFYVNDNVEYFNNTYSSLLEIPKVIIYAKGNIIIGCAVKQVDAVLIADGTLSTCNEGGDSERPRSLAQLVINGAVITNKMLANRTYGGATGEKSATPAEIINYDTSLYLWGASRSEVGNSGKLETVYQTELAPRL